MVGGNGRVWQGAERLWWVATVGVALTLDVLSVDLIPERIQLLHLLLGVRHSECTPMRHQRRMLDGASGGARREHDSEEGIRIEGEEGVGEEGEVVC